MLNNLLAAAAESASGSVNQIQQWFSDLKTIIVAGGALTIIIAVIIAVLLIIRAIYVFFVPFYIHNLKKTNKELLEINREILNRMRK